MVKQKDRFWVYAVNLGNGRFRCNFCGKDYTGGASRIKYHLSRSKGWGIDICEKVSEETQLEAFQVIGIPPKRAKTMATSSSCLESKCIMSSSTWQMENSKRMDKSEVDTLFANYVLTNRVLYDDTRSVSFTNFVNGVAKYGSGYKLPSSSILKSQLIPNIRKEVVEYVKNAITSLVETGCTLFYSNCLSSTFAYTPNGVVFIDPIFSGGHTKVEIIFSAISKIGARSVVQLITDLGEVSIKNALSERFPFILHTPCAVHGINAMFQAICSDQLVDNILSLAIMIDHFVYKNRINVQVQHKWGDYWGLCKLTSFKRRERRYYWGVHKLMSLLEVESKLRNLQKPIITLSNDKCKLIFEDGTCFRDAEYVDFLIHCEEFWRQGNLIASILRPITEAFYLVVDNGASLGELYEALERVKDAGRKCCEKDHNFDHVEELLSERRNYVIHPIHVVAAFLNPTYMYRRKWKEDSEITDGIKYVLDHLVEEDEKATFMNQVEQYCQKLSKMSIVEVTTKASQTRVWWGLHGSDLHVLKKYAIRILNQPCSSSFCPQYQLHKESKHDRMLVINKMLMERYKSPETQMSESTISHEQYEGDYKRVIYWFKNNFHKIKPDPTYSWLGNLYINNKLNYEEDL